MFFKQELDFFQTIFCDLRHYSALVCSFIWRKLLDYKIHECIKKLETFCLFFHYLYSLIKQSMIEKEESFQHSKVTKQDGFFPSFIYFPFSNLNREKIKGWEFFTNLTNLLNKNQIAFSEIQNFHLSLTKTILIREQELKKKLSELQLYFKNVPLPFGILFKKITVLDNFITLQVDDFVHKKLEGIMNSLNPLMKKNNFPLYYQDPIFHISIIKVTKISQQLIQQIEQFKVQRICFSLNSIQIKAGNKDYVIRK